MRLLLAILLVIHGLIHLIGVAKGFGLADLPQLTRPVTPAWAVLWGLAALLFLATAAALYLRPEWWWALGGTAVLVSVAAMVPSWADVRAGVLANGLVLIAVVFGWLAYGPASLRAAYLRDVDAGLARPVASSLITEDDLTPLPAPVRTYLHLTGVVGHPRVTNVRVRMRGRIRSGRDATWMPFVAEQFNFFDEFSRFFYLNASMRAVPVQGYHRYRGSSATMRIKAAALVPVVQASGEAMTRAETVTLFNDMCLFAPGTLVSPAIDWTPVDDRTARAAFSNAGQTIHAVLTFDADGYLENFTSNDRGEISGDGSTFAPRPWSTPVGDYRAFGPWRLTGGGSGRYRDADGEYSYIELTIDDVRINVDRR